MRTVRRQIGFYALGMGVAIPLWIAMTEHPLFPVAWAAGVTFGFLVSWFELKRFDRAYRRTLMKAALEMPGEHDEVTRLFLDEVRAGKPLMRLNRWLGYMAGHRIERGVTDLETEATRMQRLFQPLDFGKWGIWS